MVSTILSMLGPHRIISGYPVPALCCRVPAGLGLWVRLLHALQKFIDEVNVGEGQAINLGLGLSSHSVVLPGDQWQQLYHVYNFQARSPTPAR